MSARPLMAGAWCVVALSVAPSALDASVREQAVDSTTSALLAAGDSAAAVARLAPLAIAGDASASLLLLHMGADWHDAILSERDLLERGTRAALERIAMIERQLLEDARATPRDPRTNLPRRVEAPPALTRERVALAGLLERSVVRAPWGGDELARLESMYPGSPVLARFGVRRALHEEDGAAALERLRPLLDGAPRDAELHAMRATALELDGDDAGARRAWGVTFELAPANSAAFTALLRMHREDDSLTALLDRVRRVRRVHPDLDVLIEREVELLHRLGRSEEAARVRRGGAG